MAAGALWLEYLATLCKWMTETLYLDYLDSMHQIEIDPKTEMLKITLALMSELNYQGLQRFFLYNVGVLKVQVGCPCLVSCTRQQN